MAEKVRFKAHETFLLRDGWLYKCCNALNKENSYELFKDTNAVDELGVGYNMTKSIRYWAKSMGLIIEKNTEPRGTYLTDFGKVIVKYDPYFQDVFTLSLLHLNFVSNYREATAWNIFFNEFAAKEFTEEDAVNFMIKSVEEKDIKVAHKSVETDCKMIIKMYLEADDEGLNPEENNIGVFSKIALFIKRGNKIIRKKLDDNILNKFVILYSILQSSNEDFMCLIDDLESGYNSIGKLLGLDRTTINIYLDQLANDGYIKVIRTAGLDQVSIIDDRMKNSLDILEEYYSQR